MFTSIRRPYSTANVIRRYLHTTQRRNTGYIVLVPEIGEDSHAADGMLKADGLPAFNDITIENCLGAIGHQAAAVEKTVKRIECDITDQNGRVPDAATIFHELDEVTGPLNTTWGIAKALYLGNCTLIPTKSYMNIHERARNARASKFNSKILYDALAQHQPTKEDVQRLMQKHLLEGKLNGLTLAQNKRDELKDVLLKMGKERASFKNKVNMSVHTFSHGISDYQLVREFPPTLLEALAKDPSRPTEGPWKVTLQPQIVEEFLKYCPDRSHRWNVWQANVRKASGQAEKSLENSTHVEKIRTLRKRQANILGYPSFAAMSMETKMVGSVANLKKIFSKLLQFAGPAQSVEIDQLQKFALENGFQHQLDVFDVPYWQRKSLISEHNDLSDQTLREYFPLPRVFSGLFSLSEKLFNIKIVENKEAQVWQPAVKYFDVFDLDSPESMSKSVGGFYVDCYSKENKNGRNNGWMVSIRNRNEAAKLTPLCALIFNFSAQREGGVPCLLSFDDLRMVFKTFGSAMQHLLTRGTYTDLAGLSNIEWDASQVAGNVMCNFLDNPTILKTISGHVMSDDIMPDDLARKTNLLKTHMAGYGLCHELYLADLDIELHQSTDFWLDIVRRLWPVYRCMPLDKKDAHPCSMTDIFSGDWSAALFSHLYSKVIAADVSEAFAENPENQAEVGKRFKATFLASGGTMPSAEVFRHFRGRDPSVEALLKSLNIFNATQTTGDL